MSDTPETDAAAKQQSAFGLSVSAEFARKLERERDEALATAKREIQQLRAANDRVTGNYLARIDAERKLAELRKRVRCRLDKTRSLTKERDQWRECAASLLVYAECLLTRIPDKSQINWTVLEQARSMFKEASK